MKKLFRVIVYLATFAAPAMIVEYYDANINPMSPSDKRLAIIGGTIGILIMAVLTGFGRIGSVRTPSVPKTKRKKDLTRIIKDPATGAETIFHWNEKDNIWESDYGTFLDESRMKEWERQRKSDRKWADEQMKKLADALVRKTERAISFCVRAAGLRRPAERIVRIPPVKLNQTIKNRMKLIRRNGTEQIPETGVPGIERAVSPHHKAHTIEDIAVERSSCDRILLEDVNSSAVHPAVAVIGDSTFTHSGMTSLLDAVNDNAAITVILSDNLTTAMTGGQDSAGTHKFEAICLALGVEREHLHVVVPLPKNMEEITRIIREEMEYQGVSVIIPQRECMQTLARKNRQKKAAQ